MTDELFQSPFSTYPTARGKYLSCGSIGLRFFPTVDPFEFHFSQIQISRVADVLADVEL